MTTATDVTMSEEEGGVYKSNIECRRLLSFDIGHSAFEIRQFRKNIGRARPTGCVLASLFEYGRPALILIDQYSQQMGRLCYSYGEQVR